MNILKVKGRESTLTWNIVLECHTYSPKAITRHRLNDVINYGILVPCGELYGLAIFTQYPRTSDHNKYISSGLRQPLYTLFRLKRDIYSFPTSAYLTSDVVSYIQSYVGTSVWWIG